MNRWLPFEWITAVRFLREGWLQTMFIIGGIDRTITAHTFVGLLKTESLQSLVKHHFSEAEIAAIEVSLRKR